MAKLNEETIAERLDALNGWTQDGNAITKTFRLPSFPAAIAFVTHLGFRAEAAGHHPDIDIRYNKVTVTLSTHDAGGLTAADFDLAAAADEAMG